jgi:hypothetical protein
MQPFALNAAASDLVAAMVLAGDAATAPAFAATQFPSAPETLPKLGRPPLQPLAPSWPNLAPPAARPTTVVVLLPPDAPAAAKRARSDARPPLPPEAKRASRALPPPGPPAQPSSEEVRSALWKLVALPILVTSLADGAAFSAPRSAAQLAAVAAVRAALAPGARRGPQRAELGAPSRSPPQIVSTGRTLSLPLSSPSSLVPPLLFLSSRPDTAM